MKEQANQPPDFDEPTILHLIPLRFESNSQKVSCAHCNLEPSLETLGAGALLD
jgi:hypothetical protein